MLGAIVGDIVGYVSLSLCCVSSFEGCFVAVIGMRADVVIRHVSVFLYRLVQFLFRFVAVLIDQLILKSVEVTFHRCIVIWISSFAHTLRDFYPLAILNKFPGGELASLVTMQNQYSLDYGL